LVKLLKIVSAFTVGHCLTLAIAGFGWLKLPNQPVEILVAVSVLVSALHAMRPLFAGKEIYIAGGFGLIHGLAFASTLTEFGFTSWYMALTILAFNLGIEVMQLVVVGLAVPWLILLSCTPVYTPFRWTVAIVSAFVALDWIGSRAFP
jgi:HupE / UreJ protein